MVIQNSDSQLFCCRIPPNEFLSHLRTTEFYKKRIYLNYLKEKWQLAY